MLILEQAIRNYALASSSSTPLADLVTGVVPRRATLLPFVQAIVSGIQTLRDNLSAQQAAQAAVVNQQAADAVAVQNNI